MLSLLLQPKVKLQFKGSYRILSTSLLTGRIQEKLSILVAAEALEIYAETSAEEGNQAATCSLYQLFFVPIKLAACRNSSRSLRKVTRLPGRDEVRSTTLSRGGIQNLEQRTFKGEGKF